MKKVKELDELTLLRVKLTEHIKTLDEPDAIQRIKDGKRR
jgi:cell division protein FtsB